MSDLPDKGEEKVQRCEFVHGLLFSTIFGSEFWAGELQLWVLTQKLVTEAAYD